MNTLNPLSQQTLAPQSKWQRELRDQYLAHCLPSAARIQFRTAVNSIEYHALTSPDTVQAEFEACFKAIEQIHLVGRILSDEGYTDRLNTGPLDEQWCRELRRKLFFSLSRRAKRLLRLQGLKP